MDHSKHFSDVPAGSDFEAIFNHASIGMAKVDLNGKFLLVNEAVAGILGYTTEEMLSKNFKDITHPDDIKQSFLNFRKLLDGELTNYHLEKRYIHKDGHSIWGVLSVSLVRDDDLNPIYAVAQLQDITEHKNFEERLVESEKLHRETIGSISDSVLITDDQGYFSYVCPNTNLIFGYSDEEIMEHGHISFLFNKELVSPEDLAKKKELKNIEVNIIDREKKEHFLLVNIKQVSIQNGTTLYTCRDVTELHKAKECFRLIAETINEVFWVGSDDWNRVYYVSPSYEKIWGRSCRSLYEKPLSWIDCLHPEDQEVIRDAIKEKVETGISDPVFPEYRVLHKDGSVIWISAR